MSSSGWDDGVLRAFYPESGKPMYNIKDVHGGGITALALYSDSRHIVTGGAFIIITRGRSGSPLHLVSRDTGHLYLYPFKSFESAEIRGEV